eukprot:TRINITY_DN11987_c0_g1_i1.p1 TRINITY_DN11987_c0_g1~~TRINITY_DN11987_c0_g1_i1.p1  ORF type:complete len:208 (+),score=-0.19 TRINITY_DN11987_c0_g1_i1:164-787(+)
MGQDSFKFVIEGLTSMLLGEAAVSSYSLFGLGARFLSKTQRPHYFWNVLLDVLYFAMGIIVPFVYLIFLLILWSLPMTVKVQKLIFKISEILNAWSSLEVFIIALLATLTELSRFAIFLIGDKCNPIDKILKDLDQKGIIHVPGHVDRCFYLVNKLETGCWLLFTASLFYIVLGSVVLRALQNSLEKRMKEEQIRLSGLSDSLLNEA